MPPRSGSLACVRRHLGHRAVSGGTQLRMLQGSCLPTLFVLPCITFGCLCMHTVTVTVCCVLFVLLDQGASFRSVMSWLTVLHIGDRAALLTECHRVLQPGAGVFFAADFYDKGLEEGERKTLADDVDCHYLPTLARYAPFTPMKAPCSSLIATCFTCRNKLLLPHPEFQ